MTPAVQPPSVLLLWEPLVSLGLSSGFCSGYTLCLAGQRWKGSGNFGWQIKFFSGGDNN